MKDGMALKKKIDNTIEGEMSGNGEGKGRSTIWLRREENLLQRLYSDHSQLQQ
jgi:hypothetical protein